MKPICMCIVSHTIYLSVDSRVHVFKKIITLSNGLICQLPSILVLINEEKSTKRLKKELKQKL
jgi:hypothetical protein